MHLLVVSKAITVSRYQQSGSFSKKAIHFQSTITAVLVVDCQHLSARLFHMFHVPGHDLNPL